MVALRVLQEAQDQDTERRRDMVKAVQVAVQNGVARAFKGAR